MYLSQSKQIERVVESLFPSPGFFLEIGAWSGENISQTAYLERVEQSANATNRFRLNFVRCPVVLWPRSQGIHKILQAYGSQSLGDQLVRYPVRNGSCR